MGRFAEIDALAWQFFLADYFRPACPSLASCYRRVSVWAAGAGISVPSISTFRRAAAAQALAASSDLLLDAAIRLVALRPTNWKDDDELRRAYENIDFVIAMSRGEIR